MGLARSTWTVLNVDAELSPESINPGEEPSPVPVQLSGVATDYDGAPVSGVTVFAYRT